MIDFEEIERRLAAATPGPWREGTLNVWQDKLMRCVAKTERGKYRAGIFTPHQKGDSQEQMQRDAELIAHAPADLRTLLDEVRRLRGELELHEGPRCMHGGWRGMDRPGVIGHDGHGRSFEYDRQCPACKRWFPRDY